MILNQLLQHTKRTVRKVILPLTLSLTSFYTLRCTAEESQQPKGRWESCATDNECLDNLVCESGQCVPYIPNGQGGNHSPFRYPSTPEETFNGFRSALRDNNRERAVQYFAPHVQDSYQAILSRKNLSDLARTIPELKPAYRDGEASTGNFVQYEVPINGETYAITFNCSNGECKIIGF